MTLEEIKELIQVLMESGVAELEVQRGDNRVRIRRGATQAEYIDAVGPAPTAQPLAAAPMLPAGAGVPSVAEAAPVPPAPEENLTVVKSPIVGTYYDSASPGAPAFVKVGDTVQPGQVLCIIESMKLMNEIEAEDGGVIVSKLVENGRPVEYGESLFTMRPR